MQTMLQDLANKYWQMSKSQIDLEKKFIEMDGLQKKNESAWEQSEMAIFTKIKDLTTSPPL